MSTSRVSRTREPLVDVLINLALYRYFVFEQILVFKPTLPQNEAAAETRSRVAPLCTPRGGPDLAVKAVNLLNRF